MRILFVTPLPPSPANTGGRQRTKLLLEAVRRVGEVDFVLHSNHPVSQETLESLHADFGLSECFVTPDPAGTAFWAVEPLFPRRCYHWAQDYASRASYYSTNYAVADALDERIRREKYDAIVVRYLRCAVRSGLLGQPGLCVDVDDVDWDHHSTRAVAPGTPLLQRWVARRHSRNLQQLMPRWLADTNLAWVCKQSDVAKLQPARASVLPNAIAALDEAAGTVSCGNSDTILFVGALGWEPNQAALRWFLASVFPLVRQEVPSVRLRVVGSAAPSWFSDWLRSVPSVEYAGEVDSVAPHYQASAFTVIPTLSGAGSHIKVPESLAHGVTCVTSPYGHRGYEDTLMDGQALVVANGAEHWVHSCVQLLRDRVGRHRLARQGRSVAQQLYSPQAFYRNVERSLDAVAEAAGRR